MNAECYICGDEIDLPLEELLEGHDPCCTDCAEEIVGFGPPTWDGGWGLKDV